MPAHIWTEKKRKRKGGEGGGNKVPNSLNFFKN